MERYKYCPPPSIIIIREVHTEEVGEMFKLKHNIGRRTKLAVKILRWKLEDRFKAKIKQVLSIQLRGTNNTTSQFKRKIT